MKKIALLFGGFFLLAACKPDVEVELSTDAVMQVAKSQVSQMIDFEATIEERYTTVDDEKKAQVSAIARAIESYFHDVDVEVSYVSDGFEIEVEGELELVSQGSSQINPWYFSVNIVDEGQYYVSLQKSVTWGSFAEELKDVSFMAAPDDFLPIKIKLKNNGGKLIVGGAILDGELLPGYRVVNLDGSRVNLTFDGDHWENAPASFLFVQP